MTDFEQMAWSLLPQDYEPIELAPLCPLGTSSVVAAVDQNMAVAADRNVEVVSDSTNVLALEAALRRRIMLRDRDVRATAVRLAASQRQVRAQHYASPTAVAHFRLLALVAAGRSTASAAFECRAMVEQIGYLVSLLHKWRPGWAVEVAVSDFRGRTRLMESAVLAPLRELVPGAALRTDVNRRAGRGYYVDLCYKLYVTTATATRIEVGDGGCVDWTAKLLSDQRERLVISGIGIERLLG